MNILYVAIGGAFGSVMRYLMQGLLGRLMGMNFPYGTLVVNLTGSILMGVFIGSMSRLLPATAQDLRLFVAVGILGGFTTFSSFSLDAITLMEEQRWLAAFLYILGSVLGGVLGLYAALRLMRQFA